MAKFANITYGTKGESAEYTYVVNDNVRAGDILQPTVKHVSSGKIYATTGIVQSTAKETSVKGKEMLTKLQSNGKEPIDAFTGSELGVSRATRGEKGKFTGSMSKSGGTGKAVRGEDGLFRTEGDNFQVNPYIQKTRDVATAIRKAQEGGENFKPVNETFDSYSKPYMKKGE